MLKELQRFFDWACQGLGFRFWASRFESHRGNIRGALGQPQALERARARQLDLAEGIGFSALVGGSKRIPVPPRCSRVVVSPADVNKGIAMHVFRWHGNAGLGEILSEWQQDPETA